MAIGDPRLKEVRMGSSVSLQQVEAVQNSVKDLAREAQIVHGNLDHVEAVGANASKGAQSFAC